MKIDGLNDARFVIDTARGAVGTLPAGEQKADLLEYLVKAEGDVRACQVRASVLGERDFEVQRTTHRLCVSLGAMAEELTSALCAAHVGVRV